MIVQNEVRRYPAAGARRVAFSGHRPQKLPFGFDETDERCVIEPDDIDMSDTVTIV